MPRIKINKLIAIACLALALLSGCNSQQAQWEEYDKLMKADMISEALRTAEEIKADNPNAKNKHGRSITEVIEGTKGALEAQLAFEDLQRSQAELKEALLKIDRM
jgi:hypothetical protein